ncbi:hypothetical protein [Natronospira bacteriovora]|uniref:Uncharacterized protein n=1 Tax=Natronospira bacteriovora TaxID=3069753 RepID=A0ABU0W436_9GAMM|nr:hypothetical protein [Natronospira sp. AB-CW4]MDQ2068784.1 hypothetical protein [Natronospira sp. AB-CW4]
MKVMTTSLRFDGQAWDRAGFHASIFPDRRQAGAVMQVIPAMRKLDLQALKPAHDQ